jgi:cytochrome bd-type quinol oxidase subunit 2
MPPFLVRLVYVSEFLLALIAALMLWAEAGGQGHLDLMPWYDKLVLPVALAWVTVLATASAATREKAWNRFTVWCVVVALMIAGVMGALTYYYHLQEDDQDEDGGNAVAVIAVFAQDGQS